MKPLLLAMMLQCPDGTPPPCSNVRAVPAPPRSVAVFYFQNRSSDSTDAYLGDGLTEGVIGRLARDSRLSVKSTSAMARFRGRTPPPDSAGRVLRVAHLVSGSVARLGSRLRVSVELVRASTGVTLWAGQFDRDGDDLFEIQAAIADTVAREIAGRLVPLRGGVTRRPTESGEAYSRYLEGNYRLARRTPDDVRLAIRNYEQAVALDPGFAAAHARIALAYGIALDWGWPSFNGRVAIRSGLAESSRALELDSMSADAWTARGYILRFANARTYAGVREAFSRAVALDPRNAETQLQYGWALANLGLQDQAMATIRRAITLDPEHGIARFTYAWVLLAARRTEDAIATLDTAIINDPGLPNLHWMRAMGHLLAGDSIAAQRDIERERGGDLYVEATRGIVSARLGDTAQARRHADDAAANLPAPPTSIGWYAGWIAMTYAELRDAPRALALLDRIEPQGLYVWWLMQFPAFDRIRQHPEFQRFGSELAPTR